MPHEHETALAQYRLSMAYEMLEAAESSLKAESYKTANNRAYYAVFHAMRTVLALDGADFKRHSGVISYFGQRYLATGIFPKSFSQIIRDASLLRNSSDYDDFYICSRTDTVELVENARILVDAVAQYVNRLYQKESE